MSSQPEQIAVERLRTRREAAHQAWPIPVGETWQSRRDYRFHRVLGSADALALGASLALAFAVSGNNRSVEDWLLILPTLPVWLLVFKLYGLYTQQTNRISHGVLDSVPNLAHALLVGTLLLWLFFRAFADWQLIFKEVIAFYLAAMIAIPLMRTAALRIAGRLWGPERVLVIGDEMVTSSLLRKLETHPEYGLEPVRVMSRVESDPLLPERRGPDVRGSERSPLADLISRERIDHVIVSHQGVSEPQMPSLLRACAQVGTKVTVIPNYVEVMGPSMDLDDVEGLTVLRLNSLMLDRSSRTLKRSIDLIGASLALIVAAPVMVLVALAILIDSGRPILFRQERIGRRGRRFELIKFRTMIPEAEMLVEELREQSRDPDWLFLESDPRVTRIGRFLRRSSLDELPQLFNVLKGEMSLVGPRPLPAREDERVTGWARSRLDLAPGVTGLWQVLGRTNIPFSEMVKLDYQYVTNWSPWLDLKLIMRTLPAVLKRNGAN